MADLLVSVRSAEEARRAVRGGASIIDVKEPSRGPLGRADESVWKAVHEVVPPTIHVSVALGELSDWTDCDPPSIDAFSGISYRKMGLAGARRTWVEDWSRLRERWAGSTQWIAVAYADYEIAKTPSPDEVIEIAREASCAGVLIDTWDKTIPSPLAVNNCWIERVRSIRQFGLVVLAGGLRLTDIRRLKPLSPDFFAVRGAACVGGREGSIDSKRVAALASAALPRTQLKTLSN